LSLAGKVCLVIYAYGDDGSDAKQERVAGVSIIAGYEEWWQDLERQWTVRCNGIPFHATDCCPNPPQGDYKGKLTHAEANEMYRDLTGILASSKLGGIGVGIDIAAFKNTFPNSLQTCYYRAFMECLLGVANVAENLKEVCEVTYDISKENEANAAQIYAILRESEERFCRWLHPKVSFASWKDSARLQAADLLVYEAWKATDHAVGPVKRHRKSWEVLRATGRFETFSYGSEWHRDLKTHRDSGDLEKIVGFNESDYLAWLGGKGLVHNVSNIFAFIRSRNGK
jgi:hypothetical protein